MPAQWAKVLMMLQWLLSRLIIALLAARAVNISDGRCRSLDICPNVDIFSSDRDLSNLNFSSILTISAQINFGRSLASVLKKTKCA